MHESLGNWSTEDVAGHACHVFEPAVPNEHGDVVIYLHGLHVALLSEQPVMVAELNRHGLRTVCPVTERSWWTDRICAEFDLEITAEAYVLDKVLQFIEARWGNRPPQIALFGTSMGGQGALRLAYKHADRFPVVAGIAPAIDFHLRMEEAVDETLPLMYRDPEAARQDTATLHIHPLNWPRHQFFCTDPEDRWWDSADRLRMKLGSLGVPFECDLETSAGGHSWDYYNHMAPRVVAFLMEGLDQQRRRM